MQSSNHESVVWNRLSKEGWNWRSCITVVNYGRYNVTLFGSVPKHSTCMVIGVNGFMEIINVQKLLCCFLVILCLSYHLRNNFIRISYTLPDFFYSKFPVLITFCKFDWKTYAWITVLLLTSTIFSTLITGSVNVHGSNQTEEGVRSGKNWIKAQYVTESCVVCVLAL